MKKQKLFTRILIPTLLTLLLLPPLTCIIFYQSARQYAYREAVENLANFQQSIFPLMERITREVSETDEDPNTNDTAGIEFYYRYIKPTNLSDAEKIFLYRVSPLVSRMDGYAEAMILSSKMTVIYPRDQQSQDAVAPLASEFASYIQSRGVPADADAVQFQTNDGEDYLISIYKIPNESMHIKYIISYCPMFRVGSWVQSASMMVLLISSVFVIVVIAALWLIAHSAIRPLNRLCQSAEQVGHSNFSKIETEFSIIELDELRLAMNQMSDQLMQAEEIQKNFFQNVSHELRNPLMSISGYAQGIEQGVFSPPSSAAHTILEESMRLTNVVNSLLTLSRLESGDQDTELGIVHISDTIDDCIDRLSGLAVQQGIALTHNSVDHTLAVWGTEDLIGKVLDNLLTNAIRYAKSKVCISVLQEKNHVFLTVSDDGDGISEKDMPHIFERCYKGAGGNFGIGLAIARSAAQKMEGDLTVTNQKHGGALFTLSLKNAESSVI